MIVERVMTKSVRTCGAGDSLRCPAQIMWDQDCGCVPIVDEDSRVIGMITDRDICMAALMQSRALADIPVSSAMSWRVRTCRPSDTIEFAESVLRDNQIRRLPVVDEQRRIVGIISLADIANEALQDDSPLREEGPEQLSATLAEVCRPRNGVHASR